MKKRNWTVHVEGWKPFQMVVLDGDITYAEALASARLIWPTATVE